MSTQVLSPYPYFTTRDGSKPLNLGWIYIGEPDQDPQLFPKAAFWDEALTQPAMQPLRTDGGFIVNGGDPGAVFTDGAFSIRVRANSGGSPGTQVFYRPNVPNADALRDELASATGTSLIGFMSVGVGAVLRTLYAWLRDRPLQPEDYGAVGYTTASLAQAGADYSTALQNMATAAGAFRLSIEGNGRWYKVGTVSYPSNSYVQNLKCVTASATTDNAPFFIDGQSSPKSHITFIDCEADGNRVGQTLLATSGGDGQRAGFKLFGYMSNIKLVRPKVRNAATDGIFLWSGTAIPVSGTDYLATDVQIDGADVAFCGRHGISTNSLRSFRLTNSRSFSNGADAVGWTPTGPYSNGGYARTTTGAIGGPKYGRGFTFESFHDGDGFDGLLIDGCDFRGNAGGTQIFHNFYTTSARDLRATNTYFEDNFGASGDGSLILYCVHSGSPYTGTDGYVGVYLEGNSYNENWLSLRCCSDVYINGGYINIDPAQATNSIALAFCGNVRFAAVPSNKRLLGYIPPVSLLGITQTLGTGWTVNSSLLEFVRFNPDGTMILKLTASITADAAEKAQFDAELTAGWTIHDDYSVNIIDANASGVVDYAFSSGTANNKIAFGMTSLGAVQHSIELWFTAAKG